jgi:DNA-nicking Smr family endonuclease
MSEADDRPDGRPDDDEDVPEEVRLPIEDFIDLHPFRPNEIRSVVASYLEEAVAEGFREVRVIHGRGIGVQRENVRAVLARHPLVEEFRDAPPERGGWGATIVRLREAPADD